MEVEEKSSEGLMKLLKNQEKFSIAEAQNGSDWKGL